MISHKLTDTLMEYFVLNVSEVKKSWAQRIIIFFFVVYFYSIIHSCVLELLLRNLLPPEFVCFIIFFHPIIYFSLLYSYYFFFPIPSAISFSACFMICFWPHSDSSSLFLILIMFAASHEWQGCLNKSSMPLLFCTKTMWKKKVTAFHKDREHNSMYSEE